MHPKAIHKLLIAGSTGLVGSRFLQLSNKNFKITSVGRENTNIKLNLLSEKEVINAVKKSDAEVVINFAAFTDVDGAEKERGEKQGTVYKLNALLPLWLTKACEISGKRLCHISTDYVFDGKQNNHPYTEDDTPKPVNSWYALTKYLGEENILNLQSSKNFSAIIRISYPYSGLYERKLDIARAVVEKIKKREEYFGISDQKIKPASVDDIALAIFFLIEKGSTGIFHIAGNFLPHEYITPYEFAKNIANTLNLNKTLIKPISFGKLSKKRLAPRPQHTWLDTKKIESLGFEITNFDKALTEFKLQMQNNKLLGS